VIDLDIPKTVATPFVIATARPLHDPASVARARIRHPLAAGLLNSSLVQICTLPAAESSYSELLESAAWVRPEDRLLLRKLTHHTVVMGHTPPVSQPEHGQAIRAIARVIAEACDGIVYDAWSHQALPHDFRFGAEHPEFCLADDWLATFISNSDAPDGLSSLSDADHAESSDRPTISDRASTSDRTRPSDRTGSSDHDGGSERAPGSDRTEISGRVGTSDRAGSSDRTATLDRDASSGLARIPDLAGSPDLAESFDPAQTFDRAGSPNVTESPRSADTPHHAGSPDHLERTDRLHSPDRLDGPDRGIVSGRRGGGLHLVTAGMHRFALPELEATTVPVSNIFAAITLLRCLAVTLLDEHWDWLACNPGARSRRLPQHAWVEPRDVWRYWGAEPKDTIAGRVRVRLECTSESGPDALPYLSVGPPADFGAPIAEWWNDVVDLAMPYVPKAPRRTAA
jgi:hypothetical protein